MSQLWFISLFELTVFLVVSASYGGDDSYSNSYASIPEKVEAAIMSKQIIKTIPVASQKISGGESTIVDINGGGGGGLVLRFNSGPGSIQSEQKMNSGGAGSGKVQKQSIIADPDLLIQDVQKPVIQKVRLQITPIRKVFQEVRPVQEQVETLIAKGMNDGGDSKYPPPSPPLPKY